MYFILTVIINKRKYKMCFRLTPVKLLPFWIDVFYVENILEQHTRHFRHFWCCCPLVENVKFTSENVILNDCSSKIHNIRNLKFMKYKKCEIYEIYSHTIFISFSRIVDNISLNVYVEIKDWYYFTYIWKYLK